MGETRKKKKRGGQIGSEREKGAGIASNSAKQLRRLFGGLFGLFSESFNPSVGDGDCGLDPELAERCPEKK